MPVGQETAAEIHSVLSKKWNGNQLGFFDKYNQITLDRCMDRWMDVWMEELKWDWWTLKERMGKRNTFVLNDVGGFLVIFCQNYFVLFTWKE